MPESSPRNYGVALTCPQCGQPFVTRRRRVYCSVLCRLAANRQRQAATKLGEPATPPESTPAST